ncbi:hypothetical protein CDD80_5148 [Ophiocordyceps camponoti-rufipedis]|uniref:Glucose 1-dehydrogenase n=1 Tax=Ophiocordyceps camponoti-rufipedis TaxID=2004952 RepID=A0A2C5YW31_9HYPO|nr:hypothetical protein CDD80_5148 [Ophiocordyceps camponoti-rufipedis]
MALLLAGKTAIITGGTTGIGRAICLEYLRQGASVVVNHLDDEGSRRHAESLVEEAARSNSPGQLALEAGDVRDPAAATRLVERAVAQFGRLDVCVSNAGVCTFADLMKVSPALLEQTMRTNFDGAFFLTQAAAQQMAHAQTPPGGSIIGISSVSALVGGSRQAHYTPSKAAVLNLMQSAAAALGSHGIRCNALLPGTIHTRLNGEDLADGEKRRYMEGRIPLGRIGVPADVAGPAVFLACDELSGYVTGAQLLVDGGLFVNLQ